MLSQRTCKPFSNPPRNDGLKRYKPKGKKRKNVIPEYDAFPVNKSVATKVKRVGKTVHGFSIKRGCMRCFVAKQLYLDPSLCMLVYRDTMHTNARGEHCHETMVSGFRYALGAGTSFAVVHGS